MPSLRIHLAALLLIAGAALAAEVPDLPPPADPVLAGMGAELYARHCAACHGTVGRGDGPAAPSLKTPPSDLTAIALRRGGSFPAGEVAQFIDGRFAPSAHGSRDMPVWGERFGAAIPESGIGESVARGNIATLVEFLKSIQRPAQTGDEAED